MRCLRRIAQYAVIRRETSWRSSEGIVLRPRLDRILIGSYTLPLHSCSCRSHMDRRLPVQLVGVAGQNDDGGGDGPNIRYTVEDDREGSQSNTPSISSRS